MGEEIVFGFCVLDFAEKNCLRPLVDYLLFLVCGVPPEL